jgi:hypothetical protein
MAVRENDPVAGWVSTEERAKDVCDANGDEVLRRSDGVPIDTAKDLGNGDVLAVIASECKQSRTMHQQIRLETKRKTKPKKI